VPPAKDVVVIVSVAGGETLSMNVRCAM